MITPRRLFGNQGEALAAQWLEQQGFTIITKNFQVRLGEIDIVARKEQSIVFVEVKTRKQASFNLGATITITKQRRIGRAATSFILSHAIKNMSFRFDVIIVVGSETNYSIQHIPNAFTI